MHYISHYRKYRKAKENKEIAEEKLPQKAEAEGGGDGWGKVTQTEKSGSSTGRHVMID